MTNSRKTDMTQLSEVSAFTVDDIANESNKKRITFSYKNSTDPNHDKLAFRFFIAGNQTRIIKDMLYSHIHDQWELSLDMPATTHGFFIIAREEENKAVSVFLRRDQLFRKYLYKVGLVILKSLHISLIDKSPFL